MYETTCKVGDARKVCRSEIGPEKRKEIDISKTLNHEDTIQLVGTYAYHNFRGVLADSARGSEILEHLIASDILWVTDFQTLIDFLILPPPELTMIRRGTPKRFPLKVLSMRRMGRQVFSLGCVYLEMLYLCLGGCLETLKAL